MSFLSILTVLSCSKREKGCFTNDLINYATAESNYQNWNSEASLFSDQELGEFDLGFILSTDDCFVEASFSIKNLSFAVGDQIFLDASSALENAVHSTAIYNILDGDATPVETYVLVEDADNFVIVDKLNHDSTELRGRFQTTFVTASEKILSGERERWDDPNRPDTLKFFNGEFLATTTE